MGSKQRVLKRIPSDSEFDLLAGQLARTEELAVEVLGNVQALAERLTSVGESIRALGDVFYKCTDTKAMADPCARFQFANRGVQQQSSKLSNELLASVVNRIVRYLAVFALFKERLKRKEGLQAEYEKKRARMKKPPKDGEPLDETDPKADTFWHTHQLYATGITELLDDMKQFYWHRSHFFAEFLYPITELECEIGCCLSRMTEEDLNPIKASMDASWASARRDPAADLATLSGIVADADMGPVFEAYLDKEFSGENLRFYRRVEHYVTITSQREREGAAREIFDTYVKPGAEFQVNVDASIVQSLRDQISDRSKITERVFDEAFDMISELMTRDSMARFAKTQEYRDVLHKLRRQSLAFWDKVVQEGVVDDSPLLSDLMHAPEEEKLRERERQRQKEEKERERQRAKELREEERRRKEEERDRLEREKQDERRRKEEERDRAERERQEKVEKEKQEREREKQEKLEREKQEKQRMKEEKQQPKAKKPRGKETKDSSPREDEARSPRGAKADDRAVLPSSGSAAVLAVPGKPEIVVEVPVLPFAHEITTGRSQLRKTRVLDSGALHRSASMASAERGSVRPMSGAPRNASFVGTSGSFAGSRSGGVQRGGGARGGRGRGRQGRANREEPIRAEHDGASSLRGARASLRPSQRSRTASGVFVDKAVVEACEAGPVRTPASSRSSKAEIRPATSSGMVRSTVSGSEVAEQLASAPASVSVSPVSPGSAAEPPIVEAVQFDAATSKAETASVGTDSQAPVSHSEFDAAVAAAAAYEGGSREADLELCDEATYDSKYGAGAYRTAFDQTYGTGAYEAAYDEAYGPGAYRDAYDAAYGAGAYELAQSQEAKEWAAYEAAVAEAQEGSWNYDAAAEVGGAEKDEPRQPSAVDDESGRTVEAEDSATADSGVSQQAPGDFVSAGVASITVESGVAVEREYSPEDSASQAMVTAAATDLGDYLPVGSWGESSGGDWEEAMLAATEGLSLEGEDHSGVAPSIDASLADGSVLAELSVMGDTMEFASRMEHPAGDFANGKEADVASREFGGEVQNYASSEKRPESPEEVSDADSAVVWGIEAPAPNYVEQETEPVADPFGVRLSRPVSQRTGSQSGERAKVGRPSRGGGRARPEHAERAPTPPPSLARPPVPPPSLRCCPSSMQ